MQTLKVKKEEREKIHVLQLYCRTAWDGLQHSSTFLKQLHFLLKAKREIQVSILASLYLYIFSHKPSLRVTLLLLLPIIITIYIFYNKIGIAENYLYPFLPFPPII